MAFLLNEKTGKMLEEFNSGIEHFPFDDKLDTALTLAGFKQGTIWEYISEPGSTVDNVGDIDKYVVENMVKYLKSLGLEVELTDEDIVEMRYPPEPYCKRLVILIAGNKEGMNLNRELWGNKSRVSDDEFGGVPENPLLYGKVAGFPKTAIDGFINGTSMDKKNLPQEYLFTPTYAIMNFLPSKDHWKAEYDETTKQADELMKYVPNLINAKCERLKRTYKKPNKFTAL